MGTIAKLLLILLLVVSPAQARQWHAAAVPAPTPTCTPDEFAVDRIFQRVGTAKTITFTGSYTNVATAIDIQIIDASSLNIIIPWTTLQTAPVGGTFSGTLSVPQYNGWMKWMVRAHNNQNTSTTSTNKFGVGALILLTGQSNMAGLWAKVSGSPPTPTDNSRRYAGNGWRAINAAFVTGEVVDGFNSGRGGDGICQLANQLHTLLGVNVGLLEYAVGGTSSAQWAPGGTMYVQTIGPGSVAPFGITYVDVGSDAEAVFHYQGESDAVNNVSGATWQANVALTYSGFQGIMRSPLPFGIQYLGWAISYPGVTDTNWSTIKNAQLSYIAGAGPNVYSAAYGMDGTLQTPPLIHYSPASYVHFANRLSQSYAYYLGLTTYGAAGPSVSGITWSLGSPALITIAVTPSPGASIQDGAGGSGASLNGFQVFNGATQLPISSTVISGNNVILTMSGSISQASILAGTVKVRYEFGQSPHGTTTPPNLANYVFDTAIPAGDTIGLPLLPTNGLVTVTQ